MDDEKLIDEIRSLGQLLIVSEVTQVCYQAVKANPMADSEKLIDATIEGYVRLFHKIGHRMKELEDQK